MPDPCSKNLSTFLVIDYVQKRRCQALLFSFEHNLLSKLLTNFYHYTDQPLSSHQYESTKNPNLENKLFANLSKDIINTSYFKNQTHEFSHCKLNEKKISWQKSTFLWICNSGLQNWDHASLEVLYTHKKISVAAMKCISCNSHRPQLAK